MKLVIAQDGSVRAIYSDAVQAFLGQAGLRGDVARASHVEPNADGSWGADMAPVAGPVLGPFPTRAAALSAEVAWLEARNVPVPLSLSVPQPSTQSTPCAR